MYLMCKYAPFKRVLQPQAPISSSTSSHPHHHHHLQQQQQQQQPKDGKRHDPAAVRELQHLNHKIDKLLAKMDNEDEERMPYSADDQCAICMSAKATMQTLPCGHRVVCRKCFIKTIQSAIADHALPLKCIVCRASVLKLGSCKKLAQSSTSQSSSSMTSAASATPSKSLRRNPTAAARAVPSRAPPTTGATGAEGPVTRSIDVGRAPPAEFSSTAARYRESSTQRRGCCHHHHIPLRQLNPATSQEAAAGSAGTKVSKLQPLPIYPARGSAPTQRRAFSSAGATAMPPPPEASAAASAAETKDRVEPGAGFQIDSGDRRRRHAPTTTVASQTGGSSGIAATSAA